MFRSFPLAHSLIHSFALRLPFISIRNQKILNSNAKRLFTFNKILSIMNKKIAINDFWPGLWMQFQLKMQSWSKVPFDYTPLDSIHHAYLVYIYFRTALHSWIHIRSVYKYLHIKVRERRWTFEPVWSVQQMLFGFSVHLWCFCGGNTLRIDIVLVDVIYETQRNRLIDTNGINKWRRLPVNLFFFKKFHCRDDTEWVQIRNETWANLGWTQSGGRSILINYKST